MSQDGGPQARSQQDVHSSVADKLAIHELLAEYAYCVDSNHLDELVELFTEDCDVLYSDGFGALGQVGLKAVMSGIPEFFAATSHHISNIVVRFRGDDVADVRAVVYAWHRYVKPRRDSTWLGYYDDRVIRTVHGWRIARLRMLTTGTVDHHVPPSRLIPLDRR